MPTAAEVQADLNAIDAKLKTGVQSVSVDGTSTAVNVTELKKERVRLRRLLNSINASGARCGHGIARGVNLGGF